MNFNEILYGVAYYDEYMPYDRIETDFKMIRDAGMNVIRIAESTWSTWEPEEGVFDFTHLHRMLDCAAKYELNVIVGTPTYAIPSWLAKKYPDILAVTHNGKELYGHRQNMDITNPDYLHHAQIIIEKLMEQVKDYDCVIGFQLDNETKPYDTCSKYAQAKFVEYLKNEFPDIDEFNREFGLDYWSNRVDDWDAFPDIRGTINMSLDAEYKKFQRKLVTDFFAWQADIVKKYKRDDQFITHNFDFEWHDYSYGMQPEVNQYEAAKCMNIAGCDIYHPSQSSLSGREITACGNIARGIKGDNYLVLETEAAGNHPWLPYPGQLRLQAYSHIANGSNSVMYWHWHSIHNAIESYWKGVLSHDFSENATYREASEIGAEWKRIGTHLMNLKKENRVAVLLDNLSLSGLRQFPLETTGDHSYNAVMRWLADALYRRNIEFDMVSSGERDFSAYDFLVVPALYAASDDLLGALDRYVAEGGHLIATFRTGFADEQLKIHHDVQPHLLGRCLGIHYDQFTYPKNVRIATTDGRSALTHDWMELVTCDTATPLAHYDHPFWGSYAAVTENAYQKGSALYLGAFFDDELLEPLLVSYLSRHGYEGLSEDTPQFPLIVKRGTNDFGKNLCYYFNYSDEPRTVTHTGNAGTDLLTDTPVAAGAVLTLAPWGLAVVES